MSETLNKSYVSVGEPLLPAGKMFFTIQPHNFTITGPGQEVTFRGVAVGAFGYLWAWRPDPSAEWVVIDGEETDTFTTTVTAGMNGWQFICVAFDAEDNYLESRIATITCTGLTEVSQDGAIVTIEQGPVELKSLVVNIEPVQEGSGDPSSENIRAISGHIQADVVVCGRNLFDGIFERGTFNNDGTTTSSTTRLRTGFIPVLQGNIRIVVPTENVVINEVYRYDQHKGYVSKLTLGATSDRVVEIASGVSYVRFSVKYSDNSTITLDDDVQAMLILGSESAEYESYNGTINTITFGETVYSGYLDVLKGKLYTCPYYASYDGETLTGHWISDRDVYAEGTTPTTGAQVVNDGGTLTEVELTPVDISTVMGQNNIYASTGDVSVTYLDWPAAPEEIELNPQIQPISPLDIDPVLEPAVDDIQPIEFDTLL